MNKALLCGVMLSFTLLILMPHIPAVEYQASETAVKEQFTEDLLSPLNIFLQGLILYSIKILNKILFMIPKEL